MPAGLCFLCTHRGYFSPCTARLLISLALALMWIGCAQRVDGGTHVRAYVPIRGYLIGLWALADAIGV